MRYLHELRAHRTLFGYITLVLALALVLQVRQVHFNDEIKEAQHHSCLALQGNVEAQRIALLALIRAATAIAPQDPTVERELPYLHLALNSLNDPRCAR